MLPQPPLWLILIAFLLALGPLVFIHELGHYLVARWFKIRAETFSIGFGREVFGWTDKLGTRWKIGWLPLGGYVKFVGDMNPASAPSDESDIAPEDRPHAFQFKPVWQRFLVVLAGPVANFLTAILIFAAFFAIFGMPSTPNRVSVVRPDGAAAQAGIRPGDRIMAVAGRSTPTFEDISSVVMLRANETVRIDLDREGRKLSVPVLVRAEEQRDRFGQRYQVGRLGVEVREIVFVRPAVWEILPKATVYTWRITRSMMDGLWQIVTGRRSAEELGGPIKIAQIAGQHASMGIMEFVQLVALFSINLGFINLLPVPMLDGGHLAFYTVEAVRRRPLSPRATEWAFRGGLALLLALVVFTTVNDLGSVGLFDRLHRLIG